jgi:hypothetical protein
VAGVVVPAGVDAARNLELQFAKLALAADIGKAFGDLLRQGIERALASAQ